MLRSLVNIHCFLLVPVVGTPIPDPELVYASWWSRSHISGVFWLTLHLKHEWYRFKIQSCALCSFFFFWLSLHFVKVFPFLFFKNYVFILSCAGFSLLFSGFLSFWCMGFSCCRTQALGPWASVVVAQGLSCPRRVESSWARDQTCVLCIVDNASGFLTTEPPGKSESLSFPR